MMIFLTLYKLIVLILLPLKKKKYFFKPNHGSVRNECLHVSLSLAPGTCFVSQKIKIIIEKLYTHAANAFLCQRDQWKHNQTLLMPPAEQITTLNAT